MRKFLKFIQDNGSSRRTNHSPLEELEWENIVKKAKKDSTSSVFSKRNYAMCECALGSKRLTKILVAC